MNTWAWCLPLALALCRARPAFFIRVCGSRPCSGAQARPTEPVTLISWLSTNSGLSRVLSSCWAICLPSLRSVSSSRTANSLLAKRARLPPALRLLRRRRARLISSLSPVWWPRLSLMRLKLSMSTSSRHIEYSPSRAKRSSRLRMNAGRLPRLVRLSV
ncbi:hypothetical protein D3C75_729530 [compost metagenome]